MRVARAFTSAGTSVYGWVIDDHFQPLASSPFDAAQEPLRPLGPALSLAEVRLLTPCQPSKIVCIGRNYQEHAAEHGVEVPTEPLVFLKPPSALLAAGEPVLLTPLSQRVEHEGELCVVVGRRARHLTVANALEAVFGYTAGNDVTARDLQRRDGQWSRAKGFDTFCPLGPWIETELDWQDQTVECWVNGSLRQQGHSSQMIFGIPQLLAYVSAAMTLEPGDVLMTGTPSGVGPLLSGDEVSVRISSIGALNNPIRV